MRNKIGILALTLCAFFSAQGAFADQLVTNGGFETGDFTGWTLTGPVTTSPFASDFYGVDTPDAANGSYGAYLGSEFSVLTLSQTLTVQPGHDYTVSFSLAQSSAVIPGNTNSFLATLGGQTVFSETDAPVSGFTNYSFTVDIPSNSTGSAPLLFASENDLGYFSLDNVSVSTATPEPATWLLIVPMLGLFLFIRRKNA